MKILDKTVICFKIVVDDTFVLLSTYNTETDELVSIDSRVNNATLKSLCSLFLDRSNIFAGYHNAHFCNTYMNLFIKWKDFFTSNISNHMNIVLSTRDQILNEPVENWKDLKYANNFLSIDVLSMLYPKSFRRPDLRTCALMHGAPVVESDDIVEQNEIDVKNIYFIMQKNLDSILNREEIYKTYNANELNRDDSAAGVDLIKRMYMELNHAPFDKLKPNYTIINQRKLEELVFDDIEFRTPEFQQVFNELKNIDFLLGDKFSVPLNIRNVQYSFNTSGLKGCKKTSHYHGCVLNMDVTSMFPSIMLKKQLKPKHLNDSILNIYKHFYQQRLLHKHNGNDNMAKITKMPLVGFIGQLNVSESWLYDPWLSLTIRLNAMLYTAMLLEMLLTLGCEIIQTNTDSVCILVKDEEKPVISKIVKYWNRKTGLSLSFTEYTDFYQYDLNNWFALQKDGTVVTRGMFSEDAKYSCPAINKMIIQKLLFDKNLLMIIKDLKREDYYFLVEGDNGYRVMYNNQQIHNSNRVVASTDGLYITKIPIESVSQNPRHTKLVDKSGVTLCNNIDEQQYLNIDVNYYYSEANKIIEEFTIQQLELF